MVFCEQWDSWQTDEVNEILPKTNRVYIYEITTEWLQDQTRLYIFSFFFFFCPACPCHFHAFHNFVNLYDGFLIKINPFIKGKKKWKKVWNYFSAQMRWFCLSNVILLLSNTIYSATKANKTNGLEIYRCSDWSKSLDMRYQDILSTYW